MESIRRKLRGDGFEKMPDYLSADHFAIKKTFRFGFPELATCIASSHEHGLIAIGSRHGMVQLLGKPGIEKTFWHPEMVAVRQLVFVPNKAQLLSLCDNAVLYLWSLEEKVPDVLHKVAFGQDNSYNKPSCVRVLVDTPWAYVGCEGSDVYVLSLDTMELAGYVIHWNKLCGGYRQGRVIDVRENPWDRDKLLIGFSEGLAVVWSLQKGEARRFTGDKKLTAVCWGDGGKTFYAGYIDGTIATWNLKTISKPDNVVKPCIEGLKAGKHLNKVPCNAIGGISMIKMTNGEQMLVIAGGDATDSGYQSVSIFTGKGGTGGSVFALDSNLVDHTVILETNHLEVPQSPKSLVVLCEKGLSAYSLDEKQLCTLHVPHPLDLHSSRITCLHVISNVSDEIISSMMSLQSKLEVEEKATGKPLMLSGGKWSSNSSRKLSSEVVITGHTDGVIRVWNLVGAMFQPGLQIDTAAHLSKQTIPAPAKQSSSSLTPRMARLMEEYEVIDEDSVGLPKATSPVQEGGPTSTGGKSPKTQGSEPATTPTSTSPAGGAEKLITPTSPQSTSAFSWTGAKEDLRGVVQAWFGFEDGYLVAVTASSCVLLYGLSSSSRKVIVKLVDVILNDSKELGEESSSSSSSAFEEEPPTSSQQPSSDAAQGEVQFPAGFQLHLICTVLHQDAASSAPAPAAINSVEYSSKFELLLIGLSRGLAIVDCRQASVLFTITSDCQLRNMADPHRRRESAPLVAMQTAQRKFTIKRTKTGSGTSQEEGKSHKSTQSPSQVRRMATTPNLPVKEEPIATPEQEVFSITNVRFTEMTVDRHVNQPVPVIWAATQDGLVAGIALSEIHKPSGPRARRFDRLATGLAYEMRGSVLAMFAVSETGQQLPSPCRHWSPNQEGYSRTMSPSRGGSLTRVESHPRMDIKPTSYLIVVSDSRIKAYDIHKIRSVAKAQLVDGLNGDFLFSATFCWIRETPCCVCIAAVSGKVFIVALKNLRLVAEIDSGDLLQLCGVSTTSVSEMGRVFTFPNNQELQVVALYKKDGERYAEQLPETSIEGASSPTQPTSPPASSLLGGVLGRKQTQLDRVALFSSGRAPAVARTASGPASYPAKKVANTTDGLTGAVQKTFKAIEERGQKMSEVEDKTERMKDAASDFERLAQQLAQKRM